MTALLATFHQLLHDSEALPLLPAADPKNLSAYLDVSARWLTLSKESLPLVAVLASRPYNQAMPDTKLWLRHVSVYLLLGLRNSVNHHTLQQGVAALLSYHQLKGKNGLSRQRCVAVIRQLKHLEQDYWAASMLPRSKPPSQPGDVMATAWLWYRLLLRSARAGFHEIAQNITMMLPPHAQQQISRLMLYPGAIHEGMTVTIDHQATLVISQQTDKFLIYRHLNQSLCWMSKAALPLANKQLFGVTDWLERVAELANQPAEGDITELADHSWAMPTTYPTAKPPASLQRLLKALNDPDINISTVVELVTAESTFTQFLNDAASRDNRMQLTVHNVKQSILTYGLERVGNMLVQYALFQRLTQHQFPLREWFVSLAQVAVLLSSELAGACGKITPQYASLVTTVTVSPLFTTSNLKCRVALINRHQRLYDVSTLVEKAGSSADSHIRQRLISLATAWQQDKHQSHLIACGGKMPKDVPALLRLPHCISGLSLIWARQWLLGQTPCEQTTLFLQQTAAAHPELLGVKEALQAKVAPFLFCPLK